MSEAALDNWQPVWNAQVPISTPVCANFELLPGAGDIHFVGSILMLWHREMHINPQRNRYIFVDTAGIELTTLDWGNIIISHKNLEMSNDTLHIF